jgi:hypothetical protein
LRSRIQALMRLACDGRQRYLEDLVAFAAQPDGAGAGVDGHVLDVDASAFLDAGAGLAQHRDDRGVAYPRGGWRPARPTAPCCWRAGASGSAGRATRARLA